MSDESGQMPIVQLPMPKAMLDKVNAMAERERQPDENKPNRARTLRRLIRKGIEAEAKESAR